MDLSILIPVYNSEEIIDDLVKQIIDAVTDIKSVRSYEIILIDDCSRDNSWEKIKFLSKKFDSVKGINLTENFGQHNALMAGIKYSTGEKIITMDDDLQHSPKSINDILNELDKDFDVCYTSYLNRQHATWKKIVSWTNNLVSSYLLNRPYKLYLSSYRGLKKKIADRIKNYDGANVFIDGLILKMTRNVTIIPIEHYQRPHGSSNYTFKKLVTLWSDMAVNFPIFPLRLATLFGIAIKAIIIFYRKIISVGREKKPQYIIRATTFSKK